MCIRDSGEIVRLRATGPDAGKALATLARVLEAVDGNEPGAVSYTHLRAHETVLDLVCRLLLEKKN